MPKEYSIYDAKAQLSALVRQVRETGQTFVITVHGEPVAELRPVDPAVVKTQTPEERFRELEARGLITPSNRKPGEKPSFKAGEPKPGALQRFLEERD
jgi:prevent-host-death family protein